MPDDHGELLAYYEHEARQRRRGPLRGRRIGLRNEFLALLDREGRRTVVDYGAGPGLDGRAFQDAGHRFVGVDLANGNCRLAAEVDVIVVQGSVLALPFRPASFDAGWSCSTLMHLVDADVAPAAAEMTRALRPGAPLLVALWGSEAERLVVEDDGQPGSRRSFHLRSFDHNRQLLGHWAAVESASRWEAVADGSDYHVFRLRV